jgi:hypothetical protein
LTGRPVSEERSFRKEVLRRLDVREQTAEFGMAIHAFGDTYAHANGDSMYEAPLGHLFYGKGEPGVRGVERMKKAAGMHVDHITPRNSSDYVEYAVSLWELLKEKSGSKPRSKIPINKDVIEKIVSEVPKQPEESQSGYLTAAAKEFLYDEMRTTFKPNEDAVLGYQLHADARELVTGGIPQLEGMADLWSNGDFLCLPPEADNYPHEPGLIKVVPRLLKGAGTAAPEIATGGREIVEDAVEEKKRDLGRLHYELEERIKRLYFSR